VQILYVCQLHTLSKLVNQAYVFLAKLSTTSTQYARNDNNMNLRLEATAAIYNMTCRRRKQQAASENNLCAHNSNHIQRQMSATRNF